MAQMDISERDPLMLAYIPPWFTLWANIGGIGSSGTYLFYQRYFDESPSWQLWNGYHELATNGTMHREIASRVILMQNDEFTEWTPISRRTEAR